MKYTGTRSALALAVFAAITMEAAPALAQASALEEVVVTARKRSENLQDVPMSISAFSSKDLQNAQIDNLVEVGRVSPNVQVNETTELGYAPEWTGQIRALYRTAMAGGNLTISGDASFQDEMYLNSPIDLTNAIKTAQKGDDYWTYNAMAAYTTADEKWRFAVEGKNLSDERQLINTFDISVMANGGYTAPRTWAISAEYSF